MSLRHRARALGQYLGRDLVKLPVVLLVADLFQPLDDLAVEMFLHGDMRHAGGCRGSMPALETRRDPHNITLPDLLDSTTPLLNPEREPRLSGRGDAALISPPGSADGLNGG
jgi:hypothetical protein